MTMHVTGKVFLVKSMSYQMVQEASHFSTVTPGMGYVPAIEMLKQLPMDGTAGEKQMSIRREIGPMLRLALPLVLAELGWMSMGVVDTIMVGHLPRPAVTISAVALGQILYNTLAFGVGGVLLGLDTYISQAHGAGEWADANRWLVSGVVLAALLSAVLMGMVWVGPVAMVRMPIDRGCMRQVLWFLAALNWGTLPLFLYMTFRRYLQAFNHVRPIAAAVVTANAVNAGLDWLLLFGHRFHLGGLS